jgi:hypothetical protein
LPKARYEIRDGPYPIAFQTNEYGFREWGSTSSAKPKILFVGDSFAGDAFTPNDEAYFGVIKEHQDVEVFATGAGGYGTLQELLLLRRYVSTIEPNIFILQFCENDFFLGDGGLIYCQEPKKL